MSCQAPPKSDSGKPNPCRSEIPGDAPDFAALPNDNGSTSSGFLIELTLESPHLCLPPGYPGGKWKTRKFSAEIYEILRSPKAPICPNFDAQIRICDTGRWATSTRPGKPAARTPAKRVRAGLMGVPEGSGAHVRLDAQVAARSMCGPGVGTLAVCSPGDVSLVGISPSLPTSPQSAQAVVRWFGPQGIRRHVAEMLSTCVVAWASPANETVDFGSAAIVASRSLVSR